MSFLDDLAEDVTVDRRTLLDVSWKSAALLLGAKLFPGCASAPKLRLTKPEPGPASSPLEEIETDATTLDQAKEEIKDIKGQDGYGLYWEGQEFYFDGKKVRTELTYKRLERRKEQIVAKVNITYDRNERQVRRVVTHDDKEITYMYERGKPLEETIIRERVLWDYGANGVYDEIMVTIFDVHAMLAGTSFQDGEPLQFDAERRPLGPAPIIPTVATWKQLIGKLSLDNRIVEGEIRTFRVEEKRWRKKGDKDRFMSTYEHRDLIEEGELAPIGWRFDNPNETYRTDVELDPYTNLQRVEDAGIGELVREEQPTRNHGDPEVVFYTSKDTGQLVKVEIETKERRHWNTSTLKQTVLYDNDGEVYERIFEGGFTPEETVVVRYQRNKRGEITQRTALVFEKGRIRDAFIRVYKSRGRRWKKSKEETIHGAKIDEKYMVKNLEAIQGLGNTRAIDERGIILNATIESYKRGYWKIRKKELRDSSWRIQPRHYGGRKRKTSRDYEEVDRIENGRLDIREKPAKVEKRVKHGRVRALKAHPYHCPSRDPDDPTQPLIYRVNTVLDPRIKNFERAERPYR